MSAVPLEIQVARVLLMKGRPYLATAVWALQPVATTAPEVAGTLAVDKYWRLYYDAAALPKWTPEQLYGVLYHELHHLLRVHHQRASNLIGEPGDDPAENIELASKMRIANLAEDCEINDDLEEEKIKLPGDYCTPAKFNLPPNDLWENYYAKLLKGAKVQHFSICGKGGCGSCADGKPRAYELAPGDKDAPGISAAESELVIRKTAADVQEHARSRGTVPASLKRWADDLLNPQVPWQRLLASAVRRSLWFAVNCRTRGFSRTPAACRPSSRATKWMCAQDQRTRCPKLPSYGA